MYVDLVASAAAYHPPGAALVLLVLELGRHEVHLKAPIPAIDVRMQHSGTRIEFPCGKPEGDLTADIVLPQ